ncbi:MAG: hypothetical protein OXD40_09570 [bacterium]|nr:hypothetical protein [bacterium]
MPHYGHPGKRQTAKRSDLHEIGPTIWTATDRRRSRFRTVDPGRGRLRAISRVLAAALFACMEKAPAIHS